jgi:hypothetical protein
MAAKRPRTGSFPLALPTEEMEEDLNLVHFRSLQHDAQHKTRNSKSTKHTLQQNPTPFRAGSFPPTPHHSSGQGAQCQATQARQPVVDTDTSMVSINKSRLRSGPTVSPEFLDSQTAEYSGMRITTTSYTLPHYLTRRLPCMSNSEQT